MLLVLLLSVSISIDTLIAGVGFGIKNIRFTVLSNLVIFLLCTVFGYLSVYLGGFITLLVSPMTANIIGCALLGGLGLYLIFSPKDKPKQSSDKSYSLFIKSLNMTVNVIKHPTSSDADHSGVIDFGESVLLGIAFSADTICCCIGITMSGVDSFYIPLIFGAMNLLFLHIGFLTGRMVQHNIQISPRIAGYLSGSILLGLSVAKFFF